MKHSAYKFEIKNLAEDGTFEGLLSVYNVVDLGGDMVEYGAFTKSIAERGSVVPLLWQHDSKQPIGLLELEDTIDALRVKGKLVLEVERAREAYALMKAGVVKGLSIGYDTVKSVMDKNVRRLKELRLWEGSAVTFPMCEPAVIGAVKSDGEKGDFIEALDDIQTWSLRYQMMNALDSSIDSVIYDRNLSTDERTSQIATVIDQFREKYLDFLPRWFALMEAYKSLPELIEAKAGRRISQQTRSQVEEAISKLSALLEDPAGEEATEEDGAAAEKGQEPDPFHSWLLELKNDISGELSQ
jgi:HK97 family phage prohead protease